MNRAPWVLPLAAILAAGSGRILAWSQWSWRARADDKHEFGPDESTSHHPGRSSTTAIPTISPSIRLNPNKRRMGELIALFWRAKTSASIRTPQRQLRRASPAAGAFSITAIPWACPTLRPFRRKIPWGWTTSRFTRTSNRMTARPSESVSTRYSAAGVRTEGVESRVIVHPVRAVGTVAHDESRLTIVAMRSDGFIEELFVNKTGEHVHAGDPLFRVYSPEIISAQIDFLRIDVRQ